MAIVDKLYQKDVFYIHKNLFFNYINSKIGTYKRIKLI